MSDNAAYFYNKINEDHRIGGIDVKAEDIDIIIGEDMVCQLNMN